MTDAAWAAKLALQQDRTYTLKHGGETTAYFDKWHLILPPRVLTDCAWALVKYLPIETELIAGPSGGATRLVVALSLITGKPSLEIRDEVRSYGTERLIEGTYAPRQRVVVVEDVLSSGRSVAEVIGKLRQAGLVPIAVLALLDRLEGAEATLAALDVPYRALWTLPEVVEAARGD